MTGLLPRAWERRQQATDGRRGIARVYLIGGRSCAGVRDAMPHIFTDTQYGDRVPHNARPVHAVKATLFRVLGHPARVRILELLRDGERSVGVLQADLDLDSGSTSRHLAALRRIGFVQSRRDGTTVFYRVDDERVFDLLAAGRDIISNQLAQQQSILLDLDRS
jgi:DNA-binding transcriptional ArsR family regulator